MRTLQGQKKGDRGSNDRKNSNHVRIRGSELEILRELMANLRRLGLHISVLAFKCLDGAIYPDLELATG